MVYYATKKGYSGMIGRIEEIKAIRKAYNSDYSEFVAVYGRRRVGKTFLINEVFNYRFAFHTSGIEGGSRTMQLSAFRDALKRQGHSSCPRLTSWISAFSELENMLEKMPAGKKVVFLDELPWFDTPCSGFLKAFEFFWNGWATSRKDILLVICGSATTWIVNEILRARGGLHNRVTRQLPLAPFTLKECEDYANYKNLGFDRRQILECYMVFGGVAYYWSLLQEGQSAAQNIDRLFFGATDEMRNEFNRLFSSLFKSPTRHMEIVKLLGLKKNTMTRDEIIGELREKSSGDISKCLEELSQCGFLLTNRMIGKKKKGALYQLIDPYVLFYFRFVTAWHGNDERHWSLNYHSARTNSWRGHAFERICLMHAKQIKRAIGIQGVEADIYSWRWMPKSSNDTSVQIDMLIDRADGIVNLCEIKYSEEKYLLNKTEDAKIRHRAEVFRRESGVRKAIQPVLVAANGVADSKYLGNIQLIVEGNALFE